MVALTHLVILSLGLAGHVLGGPQLRSVLSPFAPRPLEYSCPGSFAPLSGRDPLVSLNLMATDDTAYCGDQVYVKPVDPHLGPEVKATVIGWCHVKEGNDVCNLQGSQGVLDKIKEGTVVTWELAH